MTQSILTNSDKEFIRAYVAAAADEKEKKYRRKECAKEFCVSVPTIAAITAWTTIRANNDKNNKNRGKQTTLETKPIEIPRISESLVVTGCNVNYDNPVKRLWREKWKNFLIKNTFKDEREKLTVLCLPGKQCLEIPLYLEIGIKPENITGVEGGDEGARQEFLVNADRYGIIPKIGRLENLIAKETVNYDIVSLDFTGPMCETYLDIIKNIPIKPDIYSQYNTRSFFMINVMGKREQHVAQDLMEYYSFFVHSKVQNLLRDIRQRLRNCKNLLDDYVNVSKKLIQLEDEIKTRTNVSELELAEKRNVALAFIISSLIASTRWHDNPMYAHYFQKFYELKLRGIDYGDLFAKITCHIVSFLRKFASEKFLIMLATRIGEIVQMTTNFRPFVMDIEEYSYVSPVNNSNSPFVSEMMYLYTPLAEYAKMRHLIKFIFDTVIWVADHGEENTYIRLRNKKGLLKAKGSSLAMSDTLEFTAEDKRSIASIPIHKMVVADEIMTDIVSKDKLANVIFGKMAINRIDLNDEVKWQS